MKTNVILIHADQHRIECLGAYGNRELKTPRLDGLAAEGVLHTGHFCSYPICTPSRYSLLTGMYASAHRGTDNRATLPAGTATFATELRKAGYRTAAVGKMHFTPTYLDTGFDTLVLAEQDGPGRFEDDYHAHLREHGLVDSLDLCDQRHEYRENAPADYWENFGAKRSDLPLEHHSTTYITNQALGQIERFNSDGGNLLMVGYIKPHHPFDPPEPYASLYDPEKTTPLDGYTPSIAEVDKKYGGYFDYSKLTEKSLRVVTSQYYGAITHVDDGVGQILQSLRDRGLYNDSFIIFTSDHGEFLGFKHLLTKCNHMYDPIIRIPLIIKYPASWKKTGVDHGLSTNIDIAKTILDVCGVEPAPTMRGLNLARGEARETVVGEFNMWGLNDFMARSKTHKLLLDTDGSARLFDLAADPLETRDIASDPAHAGVLRDLKDALVKEFLTKRQNIAHHNARAPVVNGKTPEETARARQDMADYMAANSSVKPARTLYA